MMPHTSLEGSILLAERLRLSIENGPWSHRAITMSLGIATTIPNAQDQLNDTALVAAADKALYISKRTGRNRWTHFAQTHCEVNEN